MSISVQWGNDQQSIIQYDIKGDWTWLDMEAGLQQSIIMTYTVVHDVHEIFDMTFSQPFPDGSMIFWRNALRVMPDNRRHMVFVGGGQNVPSLLSVLKRVAPAYASQLHTADTLKQANKLLTYLEAKNGGT